jgi:hypothetical protein
MIALRWTKALDSLAKTERMQEQTQEDDHRDELRPGCFLGAAPGEDLLGDQSWARTASEAEFSDAVGRRFQEIAQDQSIGGRGEQSASTRHPGENSELVAVVLPEPMKAATQRKRLRGKQKAAKMKMGLLRREVDKAANDGVLSQKQERLIVEAELAAADERYEAAAQIYADVLAALDALLSPPPGLAQSQQQQPECEDGSDGAMVWMHSAMNYEEFEEMVCNLQAMVRRKLPLLPRS